MPYYILADSANGDIDEVLSTIIPENEDAAWNWYVKLHEKFNVLAHSPHIGRMREDLLPSVYMFPFGNYLIFYDIIPDGIQVVHVVHGARDVRYALGQDSDAS